MGTPETTHQSLQDTSIDWAQEPFERPGYFNGMQDPGLESKLAVFSSALRHHEPILLRKKVRDWLDATHPRIPYGAGALLSQATEEGIIEETTKLMGTRFWGAYDRKALVTAYLLAGVDGSDVVLNTDEKVKEKGFFDLDATRSRRLEQIGNHRVAGLLKRSDIESEVPFTERIQRNIDALTAESGGFLVHGRLREVLRSNFPDVTHRELETFVNNLLSLRKQFPPVQDEDGVSGFSANQLVAISTLFDQYRAQPTQWRRFDLATRKARDVWEEGSPVWKILDTSLKAKGPGEQVSNAIDQSISKGEEETEISTLLRDALGVRTEPLIGDSQEGAREKLDMFEQFAAGNGMSTEEAMIASPVDDSGEVPASSPPAVEYPDELRPNESGFVTLPSIRKGLKLLFPQASSTMVQSFIDHGVRTRKFVQVVEKDGANMLSALDTSALVSVFASYLADSSQRRSYDAAVQRTIDALPEGSEARSILERFFESSTADGQIQPYPSAELSGFPAGVGIVDMSLSMERANTLRLRKINLIHMLEKLSVWPQPLSSVVGVGDRADTFFSTLGLTQDQALKMISDITYHGIIKEKSVLNVKGGLEVALDRDEVLALIALADSFTKTFGEFYGAKLSKADVSDWVSDAHKTAGEHLGESVRAVIHDSFFEEVQPVEIFAQKPSPQKSSDADIRTFYRSRHERKQQRTMQAARIDTLSPRVKEIYEAYLAERQEGRMGRPHIPEALLDEIVSQFSADEMQQLIDSIQSRKMTDFVDFRTDIDPVTYVAVNFISWRGAKRSPDSFVQIPERGALIDSIVLFGSNLKDAQKMLLALQAKDPEATLKDVYLQALDGFKSN